MSASSSWHAGSWTADIHAVISPCRTFDDNKCDKKNQTNLYPASHFKSLHTIKQHHSLNQDDWFSGWYRASGSPLSLVPCSSQQSSQQSSLQSSHEDDATRFLSPLIREERWVAWSMHETVAPFRRSSPALLAGNSREFWISGILNINGGQAGVN